MGITKNTRVNRQVIQKKSKIFFHKIIDKRLTIGIGNNILIAWLVLCDFAPIETCKINRAKIDKLFMR